MDLVIPIISSSFPEQSVGFNINNSTKQIIMETMILDIKENFASMLLHSVGRHKDPIILRIHCLNIYAN
uniref:Ovule protein n=1 Tax=Meloidogyne incognita TaxID=6306 RepID=A0A914LFN5_MELIC